ncbi:MAG TPA: zinc-binding dehydrogenase [Actinomycetes bacterium]|nr:zinc-binding dehydrogenase [Actinomycetes bacterium]
MRAVTIEDGKLAVREHPDPLPDASELLVRVRAAGLNGADLHQVRGAYPAPPGNPADIPGLDVAGEVVATGREVTRFGTGERVMAVVGGGGQAELAVVHERLAMPVPEALPWPQAGGFPEVFTTAHDALFTQCGLQLGERVLIHGAAGGVGSAAVQLAAGAGALVTATVRNPEHRDAVAELGAGRVIPPEELRDDGPFDVILELVGAPNFPANLEVLATGGRISIIGVSAGARIELDLGMLMTRRARLLGSTLRSRPLEQKAEAARQVEAHVLPAVAAGRVRVPIAASYPLDQAERAYERFRAGAKLGKVVLEP